MVDFVRAIDRLHLVGLHQRSLPARLRDLLFGEEPNPDGLLARLRDAGLTQGRETAVLATCERIEVIVLDLDTAEPVKGEAGLAPSLGQTLAAFAGVEPVELGPLIYHHEGRAAAAHLFRVAASLDSQVVGEPQVLGQVKADYRRSLDFGVGGPLLDRLFAAAFAAAAKVRHETPLAEQPVSIVASALQVARRLHGDLSRLNVLMIGLGEMSELLAVDFQRASVAELILSHDSAGRAEAAAARLGCHHWPMGELPAAMARADIIVSDRGAGRWTVTEPMVAEALKARRNRPIFLIDAALPGDIETAIGDLPDAFLYDLQDLESAALAGRSSRAAAIEMAQGILDEALEEFVNRSAERTADPALAALHGHFEKVRLEVLQDPKLDRDAATRLLIKRLLHGPSQVLRNEARDFDGSALGREPGKDISRDQRYGGLSDAVCRLFELNDLERPENPDAVDPKEEL